MTQTDYGDNLDLVALNDALNDWAIDSDTLADCDIPERTRRLDDATRAAAGILARTATVIVDHTGQPTDHLSRALYAYDQLRTFAYDHRNDPLNDEPGHWAGSGADHAAWLYQLLTDVNLTP